MGRIMAKIAGKPVAMVFPLKLHGEPNPPTPEPIDPNQLAPH